MSINYKTQERYGIIGIRARDPISNFVNGITGLKDGGLEAIGFYHGDVVNLYNTYNGKPTTRWKSLTQGSGCEALMTCPDISKITIYPVGDKRGPEILTSRITAGSRAPSTKDRIEEIIKREATRPLVEISIEYDEIILFAFGISRPVANGYSVVNGVLFEVMGVEKSGVSSGIISCPIVGNAKSYYPKPRQTPINEALPTKEVEKFSAAFASLFFQNSEFREFFARLGEKHEIEVLERLFCLENRLVTEVVSSMQTGSISVSNLNKIISDLARERERLVNGDVEDLSLVTSPEPTIKTTNWDISCVFKREVESGKIPKAMEALGNKIKSLAFSRSEKDIFGVVQEYNKMSAMLECKSISAGDIKNIASVFAADEKKEPMYFVDKKELSTWSVPDMKAALIYIESLRSKSGEGNSEYNYAQREIIQELARKSRQEKENATDCVH